MSKISDAEVETWVVHQNHHIGVIINNIFLALGNIAEYFTQVDRHLHKTHVSHRAVMLQQVDTLRLHQVATTATKLRLLVLLLDFGNEIRGVQIA